MRDADTLEMLADECERMHDGRLDQDELFAIFRAARPLADFASSLKQFLAYEQFADLWVRGAELDAAMMIAPPGCMYRSGHDGAGPNPSRFLCEAVTDAPACRRVRATAKTESLARLAAFLRAHIPMEDKPT